MESSNVFSIAAKAIVDVSFRKCWVSLRRIVNCRFLDHFHAAIGHDRTYMAAHGTTMNLFINAIIKHKIVIGKGELEK